MKKYVIVTDSCSDLEKEWREKYEIDYVPMHYSYDDKDVIASLDWETLSAPDFYNLMRNGKRVKTSQANAAQFLSAFEKYIQQGYDVLYIACSSALSASIKASCVARDELLAKYPDSKIICVDALNSCGGEGILCIRASMCRAEGKSIEETATFIENYKKYVNQEATVESLTYLKQAGRVSAMSAFFGGLLSVKPIIISDASGNNVSIEKVKGRKNSLIRVAERVAGNYIAGDYPDIWIRHCDCYDDAITLKNEILARLNVAEENFHIGYAGPILGASCGPGMIAVYFNGKEVTYDSTKQ